MQPGQLNFSIRRGDTFSQLLTIANPDPSDWTGRTPGTPVDLTGCVAELQIVAQYAVAPTYKLTSAQALSSGGAITLGGTAGSVGIVIPPADTLTLANGSYDLKIEFSDGSIQTFVAGSVFIEEEVTVWA